MIMSMTGFCRSELRSDAGFVRVEIKTTNHKFLEVSSRLPNHLAEFEDALRKRISSRVRRGKVNVFVSGPDPSVFSNRLFLNESLAREVYHKAGRLKRVLKLKGLSANPSSERAMLFREVLRYPDVLVKDASATRSGSFSRNLMKTVNQALARLGQSRAEEGKALERDLTLRVSEIRRALKTVERRLPVLAKDYRRSLEKRMKEFLKDSAVDRERLTVEVAQHLKNSDVSEEVTRLKSHLGAVERALKESGELGRKIDFIAQEMTRESNTLGAKSNDVAIAAAVIRMKSAVEKIREQAQNVE